MPTVQRKKPQQYTKEPDKFYHSSVWRSLRHMHLSVNPVCFYSKLKGIIAAANTVDHYRPRRVFPELSTDPENLRSSTKEMHDKKRQWESTIATREQFEAQIDSFIKSISNGTAGNR